MPNMFESFLNPSGGYRDAQKAAEQGFNMARGYEEPFFQHGLDQYDPLNQARQRLMNPIELENEWSRAYEPSDFAQNMLALNRTQGNEAASSMGLMGSSAALNAINKGASDIMSQDRREFLNNLMNKFLRGIGLGTDLYNTGANTAGLLGQQAINHGNNMAGLRYGEYAAPGNLLENLMITGINTGAMSGGFGGQSIPPYAQAAGMML